MNYKALIADAKQFVPSVFRVDMCRHESVKHPTFWIFDGESQIGSAAFEPSGSMPWRACKMFRGSPTAQKHFLAMDQALAFASSR